MKLESHPPPAAVYDYICRPCLERRHQDCVRWLGGSGDGCTCACKPRKEVLERVAAFRANREWLDRHKAELREQFPSQYVAVLGEEVVATHKSFRQLWGALEKRVPKGIRELVAVDFVSKERYGWAL